MSSYSSSKLFNVKGKVVLVTGGSRGIGRMIATGFVENGAKVYITSRNSKECNATAEELSRLGPGSCIAIPADLQKASEVERITGILKSKESHLNVLVNNAGATWGADIDEHPDSAFTKVFTLNVQRVFTLTQAVLPLLREGASTGGQDGHTYKDPARIINIGSVEGLQVPPRHTYSYAASKAALHHLSRHLAGRLGWEGITSNTIACGPFETKMLAHTLKTSGDALMSTMPLQRIGRGEDVAGTALFLSSSAGSFVNGATITLDGGLLVSVRPGGEGTSAKL
ncbi:NAD(P)-binding protein [Sistotremastrum suecicum HHB10207 ss-3]|uniref:NAD(P)-binding protein n=1 Tax=Sistotremastrum suecicum HHB10207 ss-3 TaxID=1314776 RepID=A0A166CFU7_9AGAM|nr:NAD(P)-binding protein [Sistotremastrum suecicum HHB10207 ss-3]